VCVCVCVCAPVYTLILDPLLQKPLCYLVIIKCYSLPEYCWLDNHLPNEKFH
jgi:hypothetical protein